MTKLLSDFKAFGHYDSVNQKFIIDSNINGWLTATKAANIGAKGDPEGINFALKVYPATSDFENNTNDEWERLVGTYSLDGSEVSFTRVSTKASRDSGAPITSFSSEEDSLVIYGVVAPELFEPTEVDGWTIEENAWQYLSATQVQLLGVDATARFPIGTKMRLENSGSKYFYVKQATFSTNTVLDLVAGDDFSVVNSPITSFQYSYGNSAVGFPQWFNYTPSYTNFSIGNGVSDYAFMMSGRVLHLRGKTTYGSTSSISGTGVQVSLPMNIDGSDVFQGVGVLSVLDSGTSVYTGQVVVINSNSLEMYAQRTNSTYGTRGQFTSTVPMAWQSGDQFLFTATLKV